MKSLFRLRLAITFAATLCLVVGSFILFPNVGASSASSQKGKLRKVERAIPDQYIVVLNDDTDSPSAAALDLAFTHGGLAEQIYNHALKGFSIRMSEAAALAVSNDPRVKYVEEDGEVSIVATQTPATWGLDRIDQRNLPLDSSYTYNPTGTGVTAYIIDTGIRISHTEFGGRASIGTDTIGDGQNGNDCNGHGTHVAGTVGGSTYGVAKAVDLVAVRVLNCSGSGTNSGVIAGVDWVTANHVSPAVANMSLGGSASTALDDAVKRSIADGVTYAVAAGNGNIFGIAQNACNYSPARVPEALTVGATASNDTEASFSNYGSCVDLLAPGVSITSSWYTSNTATNTISGTSMATPHVAGGAALYLQTNPSASPAQVESAIESNATPNKITSMASTATPNLLLYTLNFDGTTPPGPPEAPTNLAANAVSSSQINLTWNDNSDNESGFKIERCQGENCTDFAQFTQTGANAISFSDTGRAANTTYRYQVSATNGGGDSGYSNTDEATTQNAPASPPNSPTGLTATAFSSTQINLSWSHDGLNVTGFQVFRCTGTCTPGGTPIDTINDPGARNFQNTGLAPRTTYSYRVRAIKDTVSSGFSNTASAKTPRR